MPRMTAEEKARIFTKAYKESKYHIIEAEQHFLTSKMKETWDKSPYSGREMLIPHDAFWTPAENIMRKRGMTDEQIMCRTGFVNGNSIMSRLYTLNQWIHYGKEIFNFDKDLALQLADDSKDLDLEKPIPLAALDKIPGQGFFISTPRIEWARFNIDGFFVNRDYFFMDEETGEIRECITFTEVEFKNDGIKEILSAPVFINIPGVETIQDSINKVMDIGEEGAGYVGNGERRRFEKTVKFCLEFLLYLCAENAEIRITTPPEKQDSDKSEKIDKPDKPKKNHAPSIKAVGENEGTRIRTYKAKYNKETAYMPRNPNAPKREMPPHMRRSHWHSFWVGKRGTEERRLILKWLPPAYIHPEKMEEARAIVTDIGKDNGKKESKSN